MTAQDASGHDVPGGEPSPGSPAARDHERHDAPRRLDPPLDDDPDDDLDDASDVLDVLDVPDLDEALDGERALVERARTDRAAFAELYRRHVQAVYAVAYRRGGSRDVAEEATSAAFERALRSIDRFEWRAGGIRPWLFRIVSNEVVEIHRRRSRLAGRRGQLALRGLDHDASVAAPSVDVDDVQLPGGIDPTVLHAAIDRLSERHRAVVVLRYLAGLSAADAAEQLGCTKAVLAVTLHRALKALRAELDRGGAS